MLQLQWRLRDANNQTYRFRDIHLSTLPDYGVYLIYQSPTLLTGPRVIRVGQGKVADRLADHRNDPEITRACGFTMTFATWAPVETRYVSGVERFLADTYRPLIGDAFPNVMPVAVNLPFAA